MPGLHQSASKLLFSSSRRQFLGHAFGAGATVLAGGRLSDAHALRRTVLGANERLNVGVIGTGVRGKYLIGNLPDSVRVTAVCDCAEFRMAETLRPTGIFAEVLQDFRQRDADSCRTYSDYRRMIDREPLDAVIIATPDHHHTLAAIRALQAGLHVYLEKPLSVSIAEGRRLADTVARTGRILQVGSQQRTMEMNRFACEFIRGGGLGRITRVTLPNYPGPLSAPDFPEEPIPRGLDWNLFCGPAPRSRYNRHIWVKDAFKVGSLLWRGWDLWRDYSGHLMTNWGAHSVDMIQYALGRDGSGPTEIRAVPQTSQQAHAAWERWQIKTPATGTQPTSQTVSEPRRFWPVIMRYEDGVQVDFVGGQGPIVFQGERGRMRVSRNQFQAEPPELVSDPPPAEVAAKWQGDGHVARPHLQNWLDAIRSGTPLNAPVEVGHRTITVCHLANLARELNRPLRWNPKSERFVDAASANALLERPRRAGFEFDS